MEPPHFLLLLKVVHDRRELDNLHLVPREPPLSARRFEVQDQEVPQFVGHSEFPSSVRPRDGYEQTRGTKSNQHFQLTRPLYYTTFQTHRLSHGWSPRGRNAYDSFIPTSAISGIDASSCTVGQKKLNAKSDQDVTVTIVCVREIIIHCMHRHRTGGKRGRENDRAAGAACVPNHQWEHFYQR